MTKHNNELWIIDLSALLYRIHYGMGNIVLKTKTGQPTAVIRGVINIIERFIFDHNITHIAFACDVSGETFRSMSYENYKAKRKPMPEDLVAQLEPIREYLNLRKFSSYAKEKYEADDVIATIATRAIQEDPNIRVKILTSDKDMLQLVNDNISILRITSGFKNFDEFNIYNFEKKTKLLPSQIIDLKIMLGDKSDNYPGIRGIGEKTAMELLKQYGSLDGIYENLASIKSNKHRDAFVNEKSKVTMIRELATIIDDVDIDFRLKNNFINYNEIFNNWNGIKNYIDKYELYSIKNNLRGRYHNQTRVMIIDLGSNSIKYSIYYCLSEHNFNLIEHKNRFIKLIDFVENSQISTEKMATIVDEIKKFVEPSLKKYNIQLEKVIAFGTEWIRLIKNRKEFVEIFQKELNIKLEIISPGAECKYNWLAYKNDQIHLNNVIVMDIGGGSVEFIHIEEETPRDKYSISMGLNVLKNRNCSTKMIFEPELKNVEKDIKKLLPDISIKEHPFIYCSSGAFYSVMELLQYFENLKFINKFVSLSELENLYKEIVNYDFNDFYKINTFNQARADIIKIALLILICAGKKFGVENFVLGQKSIREGYLINFINQLKKGK
ncbi:MAG: 5'-3' exonuclease H3TH domain-containing protein [Mycoplasma sp.]